VIDPARLESVQWDVVSSPNWDVAERSVEASTMRRGANFVRAAIMLSIAVHNFFAFPWIKRLTSLSLLRRPCPQRIPINVVECPVLVGNSLQWPCLPQARYLRHLRHVLLGCDTLREPAANLINYPTRALAAVRNRVRDE
jgi:hypothetical protein